MGKYMNIVVECKKLIAKYKKIQHDNPKLYDLFDTFIKDIEQVRINACIGYCNEQIDYYINKKLQLLKKNG